MSVYTSWPDNWKHISIYTFIHFVLVMYLLPFSVCRHWSYKYRNAVKWFLRHYNRLFHLDRALGNKSSQRLTEKNHSHRQNTSPRCLITVTQPVFQTKPRFRLTQLTCRVMSSISRAVGSSGDEMDLRWSCSLPSCIQRAPSKLGQVFMSLRSTSRALPCLSLMGSK